MKTILLTGFEPFAGDANNPSWDACQQLDGVRLNDAVIIARQLPCVFHQSRTKLAQWIAELNPQLVLCTGLAAGRVGLSIERVGINVDDARIADNAGNQPIDTPIVVGAPAAYFSTLPIKRMLQALQVAGIPANISQTAGTFVCNHVLYGVLQHIAVQNLAIQAGFIHLPCSPELAASQVNQPSMNTQDVVRGLHIALDTACQEVSSDIKLIAGALH